ncbi:MAG TPA: hypothetical protein VMG38_09595 [Trebonia sp.]|nr:hypothetical protein [Trebonia sp.]
MWPPEMDRHHHEPAEMSTDDLVAAYALAVRFRSYEVGPSADTSLRLWQFTARQVLTERGDLERIREHLPVYFDPNRKNAVYGPGAALATPAAIESALHPAKPLRQIVG